MPGDTFFRIAQIFRTDINTLIRANPHIANPNILYPGDVLCIPAQISLPCCTILQPIQPLPLGSFGVAAAHIDFQGTQAVSIMATLMNPSLSQGFDTWIGELAIPNIGTFGEPLYPTPEEPSTWSVTIDLPTAAFLTPDTIVSIRPMLRATGETGPVILQGSFTGCR